MNDSNALGIKIVEGDSMIIFSMTLTKRAVALMGVLMPQGLFVDYNTLWVFKDK